MRLFIAIELPDPQKNEVAEWLKTLRAGISDPKGRLHWVRQEQLHLTLKFIGELPESRIPELSRALASAAGIFKAFHLSLGKVGHFGGRVVWLGSESGSPEVIRLAETIEKACREVGFANEARAFRPHVTLARAKTSPGPIHLANLPEAVAQRTFGPFLVREIGLIQSTLSPHGAIYRALKRFPL